MEASASHRAATVPSREGITRIYLDPGVLALEAERSDVDGDPVPVPGATEALSYLDDGQHQLVLLGYEERPRIDGLPPGIETQPVLPDDPGPGSWLITDDPESCQRRAPGLRSILVGPKRAPTNRPTARCDLDARDLNAAVMEILTREAMTGLT